jgi:hypothetical protein
MVKQELLHKAKYHVVIYTLFTQSLKNSNPLHSHQNLSQQLDMEQCHFFLWQRKASDS